MTGMTTSTLVRGLGAAIFSVSLMPFAAAAPGLLAPGDDRGYHHC